MSIYVAQVIALQSDPAVAGGLPRTAPFCPWDFPLLPNLSSIVADESGMKKADGEIADLPNSSPKGALYHGPGHRPGFTDCCTNKP